VLRKKRFPISTKLHLTTVDPELDRLIRATPAGAMAHWSGTGPLGTTCGQCQHFGYSAPIRNASGDATGSVKKNNCCRLYWVLMRKHGAALAPSTASCRHFVVREDQR
jgi:hypothetical protein